MINDETMVARSRYLQRVMLASGAVLSVHAFTRTRMVLTRELSTLLDAFDGAQPFARWIERCVTLQAVAVDTARACLLELARQGVLFAGTSQQEEAHYSGWLSEYFDRDPGGPSRWSRDTTHGATWCYAIEVPRDATSFAPLRHSARVVLLGACDLQMEADILRAEARAHDLDLDVTVTLEGDVELVAERPHDVVILGMLQARHAMFMATGDRPHEIYLARVRELVGQLRQRTAAPILIHGLPVPTCSPLGLADRGLASHRNRCRLANLGLVELAAGGDNLYVVDVDAAFGRFGSGRLLDDATVSFHHMGSLRWLEQRPVNELRAVHDVFPPLQQLDAFGPAETYAYEKVVAAEHVALILAILGLGRRKCVVLDLDNTLWPGVLAETGAPFAWNSSLGPPYSYVGLYFGLHEALHALKRRGVLLACISKNDESVVRELWRYPPGYNFVARLLRIEDFVACRINWDDKVSNLISLAAELHIGLDSLVFVDDSPVERERVRQYLPEVMVLGDNPFTLRWQLLTAACLQAPTITEESARRSEMVQAELLREELRRAAPDPADFLASLEIRCEVTRLGWGDDLERAHELVTRTNQFNTTCRRYARHELAALAAAPDARVYALRVEDRLIPYGLVGLCVVEGSVIELMALSCRVIGLGVEDVFLRAVLNDLRAAHPIIDGRLVAAPRNQPARHVFRRNGFAPEDDERWRFDATRPGSVPAIEPYYRVVAPARAA